MKKLSDYKGEEAIELWCDLLEPFSNIFSDSVLKSKIRSKVAPVEIAKAILKDHYKDAEEILLRIDETPIDGLNIIVRLVGLVVELENSEELRSFFVSGEQTAEQISSGNVTESTEAEEN